MIDFVIFIGAMTALIYGADLIIRESERIALHFDIPHFVIGATLVAVGTSLPELASAVSASMKDQDDLAVANVIGSVIFNITLVLGVIFLLAHKINPTRDMFSKDSAWSLFPLFVFILMGLDGELSRIDGLLFLVLMGGYVLFLVIDSREILEEVEEHDELKTEPFGWAKTLPVLFGGFAMVVIGADFAVESASNIARDFGVSEWIVGIFLIAFGTSLPELVVSIAAARKKNADMIIGNIIGSNVANFTIVLGGASLVSPLLVNFEAFRFDLVAAVVATVMLIFITANRLYNKSAGIALLVMFALVVQNAISSL